MYLSYELRDKLAEQKTVQKQLVADVAALKANQSNRRDGEVQPTPSRTAASEMEDLSTTLDKKLSNGKLPPLADPRALDL